ncbi:MAG: DNA translocase FtsK 4TM domain-containing protein, partial [Vicinamibacteria bacterium]
MANGDSRKTRLAEFFGLSAFALALMLLISLATYNPHDPAPFFKAGASGPARNFIGPVGAFLAEMLIPQLFGIAAMLIPMVLGVLGWKLFWCKPIEAPYTKGAGLTLLLLSLAAFLTLTFGTVTLEGEAVRAGGAVGELLSSMLLGSFNRTGAFIVVATSVFIALILATQFSFAAALAAAGAFVATRLRALQTGWAHYRETRRKERMRREVIKKHTQNQKDAEGGSVPRVRRVKAAEEPEETGIEIEETPRPAAEKAPRQQPLPFVAASDDGEDDAPREAVLPKRAPRRGGTAVAVRGNFALPPSSLMDEIKSEGGLDKAALFEKAKILQA